MRRTITLFVLLVIAALMIGCGENVVRREVEKSVAASLSEMIGPAKSYSVRAYGPAFAMLKGRLDALDIVGTDVKVNDDITVSMLTARIDDISVDPNTKRIRSVRATRYTASLSDGQLARYLVKEYPDVDDLDIKSLDGFVRLSARPGVSVVRTRIEADAGLIVQDQRILALDLRKLKVAGINTPSFARDFIDSKLDDIFDVRDLGFDATIRSVSITPGFITLSGNLNLMKIVESANAQ